MQFPFLCFTDFRVRIRAFRFTAIQFNSSRTRTIDDINNISFKIPNLIVFIFSNHDLAVTSLKENVLDSVAVFDVVFVLSEILFFDYKGVDAY